MEVHARDKGCSEKFSRIKNCMINACIVQFPDSIPLQVIGSSGRPSSSLHDAFGLKTGMLAKNSET